MRDERYSFFVRPSSFNFYRVSHLLFFSSYVVKKLSLRSAVMPLPCNMPFQSCGYKATPLLLNSSQNAKVGLFIALRFDLIDFDNEDEG